jgi:hypothetical protein
VNDGMRPSTIDSIPAFDAAARNQPLFRSVFLEQC